jgi:hypothetical protein
VVTSLESLGELANRVRPVALAGEERLAVLEPLEPLLPNGALRRGSTITVQGSTALALALLARATAEGSWAGVVGAPHLGLVAAAELGVALDRLALVPAPGGQWATIAAALLDAVDLVLVEPTARVRPADARRLATRARERGAVLVPIGAWSEGADVRLGVAASRWEGLGDGHGHLRARQVDVVAQGRGAAARERRVTLWLPGPDGRVASVQHGDTAVADTPARSLSVAG